MSDVAIQVEGLGKRYRIGLKEQMHDTLTGAFVSFLKSPLNNYRSLRSLSAFRKGEEGKDIIWALKDISFEVQVGEVLGIIGRNGAGKTTLLKILSHITDPTVGRALIRGRVSSLLEVGTGFHPELTGRENVYLNGTILGMTKAEIDRKFDEIVAFSGVDKFIDTPVKRYSSGMKVRLAFSVAAHLEPEILLIDEVLAVGDLEFQKKCLGKMEDVAQQGRTVLFVSHQIGLVKELCQTCLVLDQGMLAFQGDMVSGVSYYLKSLEGLGADRLSQERRDGWRDLRVNGQLSYIASTVESGAPFDISASLVVPPLYVGGAVVCIIDDGQGTTMVHKRMQLDTLGEQGCQVHIRFPALWLMPGLYTLYFKFMGQGTVDAKGHYYSDPVMLDVKGAISGTGKVMPVLMPAVAWDVAMLEVPSE